MAWNEPEKNKDKDKEKAGFEDPAKSWGKRAKEGPPELDELLKRLADQFKRFWGTQGKMTHQNKPTEFARGFRFWREGLAAFILIFYGVMGFYIVEPAERAVVTRWGRYVRTTLPGPHWLFFGVEKRTVVNVDRAESNRHSGSMLTKDENIVFVEVVVQSRIKDARAYLFNVVNPKQSLRQGMESALRQAVGQSTLDEVLTSGRTQIALAIKEQIVATLESYQTGLEVLGVEMQPAKAPDAVRAAFDDVIKAREEKVGSVNQAEAYANDIIPKAEGKAARILEEALAYKQEVILGSEGDAQRFNLILPSYQQAPEITQKRLYLEAMEKIFSKTDKVVIDASLGAGKGGPLFYLPLERGRQEGAESVNK